MSLSITQLTQQVTQLTEQVNALNVQVNVLTGQVHAERAAKEAAMQRATQAEQVINDARRMMGQPQGHTMEPMAVRMQRLLNSVA